MLRLKSLAVKNFRSFRSAEFSFPDSGLVLIQGRDEVTGESSGTGKSTVFLAIAYALDILPKGFNGTDLQSWHDDAPMQVILTLTRDGGDYQVARGAKAWFQAPGAQKVTGAKAVGEEVRKLFGVSPDILRMLTYRPQRHPGLFLTQGPAEKVEFLTKVLGLDAIEAAVEKAQAAVKVLETEVKVQDALFQSAEAEVERLTEVVAELPVADYPKEGDLKTIVEMFTGSLTLVKGGLVEAQADRDRALAECKASQAASVQDAETKLSKAKQFLAGLEAQDRQELTRLTDLRSKTQMEVYGYRADLVRLNKVENELGDVMMQIQDAQGSCPTCNRAWDEGGGQDVQQALTQKAEGLRKELVTRQAIEEQLAAAQQRFSEIATFAPNPKIQKFREVISGLETDLRKLLGAAREDEKVQAAERALESAKASVRTAEQDLTDAKARYTTLQAQNAGVEAFRKRGFEDLKRAADKFNGIQAIRTEKTQALAQEQDFIQVLGRDGFLGSIMEEVLAEIATEANRVLKGLPNVGSVSIGFQTETEKGRRQLKEIIEVNGRKARFETGLSGGMQTSVEQAVDSAVMTVVGRRVGWLPGWLCLDEVFEGQGIVTKESALEGLQVLGQDRLVLVIDHGTETKEAFTKTIDITCRDGVSTVVS